MSQHKSRIIALSLVAVLLAPAAAAQIGTFGSQVVMGDSDYQPVLKKAATQALFYESERGITGDVSDNCIYIRVENSGAFPASGAVRAPVVKKDLRATPCNGQAAGTQYQDSDVGERSVSYAFVPTSIQYADVNNNGKYDKGDYVYAVADTTANVGVGVGMGANDPQGNAAEFANGLVASTGTGIWSLRLTPTSADHGGFAAGTLVHAGDPDFTAFRGSAVKENFVLAEREDKVWYLMPGKQAVAAETTAVAATVGGIVSALDKRFLLGQDIPANSIRLGITGATVAQPSVQVLGLQLANPDGVVAGKSFAVLVEYTNKGKAAGPGLIIIRINKQIVDARMTGVLAPGESGTMAVLLTAPAEGGTLELEANDVFRMVGVEGGITEHLAAPDTSALEARIANLEAQLAKPTPLKANASGAGILLVVALLGLAGVVRRKM